MPAASTALGRWLVAAALIATAAGLWVLASPLSSGADEPAHVNRAASIALGQLLGRPPAPSPESPVLRVQVPEGVGSLPEPICFIGRPEVSAACSVNGGPFNPVPRGGEVERGTTSGRHPPFYYALVGWPMALLGQPLGVYASRAIGAVAGGLFVATALVVALRRTRPRLAVAGVLLALPPMALHLSGVVNPNGLEATAAICLWACLLELARGPDASTASRPGSAAPAAGPDASTASRPGSAAPADPTGGEGGRHPSWLLAGTGVSGVVMTLTRPISALWLALALGVAIAVAHGGAVAAGLHRRATWGWAGAGLLAGLASVGWLLAVGDPLLVSTAGAGRGRVGLIDAFGLAYDQTLPRAEEMVGVIGWLDTRLPDTVWQGYLWSVGALGAVALVLARWRARLALLALFVAVLVVPAAVEAVRYDDLGLIWQGRYTLPLAVGVPLLAAFSASESRLAAADVVERLAPLAWLPAVGANVIAFALALRRYAVGTSEPLDLSLDGWVAPVDPVVLIALFVAVEALLLAWLLLVTRRRPGQAPGTAIGEPQEAGVARVAA